MQVVFYSYRYAKEILEHERFIAIFSEIKNILEAAPLFIYPNKSSRNTSLDVVQQVMNTYFDRRFAVDCNWEYHPLATTIQNSGLAADFRKKYEELTIQAEVQFGNMSRWYSDVFKFQTAYSQNLTQLGLSVVPTGVLARRIDSNVVNYERTIREIPSAVLSITLPILLAGLQPDENTELVDLSRCNFPNLKAITGQGRDENKWRIVNGYIEGTPLEEIGPDSPLGPQVEGIAQVNQEDDEE